MTDLEPTPASSEQAEVLSEDDMRRIEGIKLASRALAHRVNNNTAGAVAVMDMLLNQGLIPRDYHDMAEDAVKGLQRVGEDIALLGQTRRIVTEQSPVGPMLNLEASSAPKPPSVPTPPKP